ncbi:hypothetical protein [Bacillus velezensis]|uniref:hypothetical protein n=1 Tax=Bacillus velezensis TaxID=492670 RepID=UPI0015F62CA6
MLQKVASAYFIKINFSALKGVMKSFPTLPACEHYEPAILHSRKRKLMIPAFLSYVLINPVFSSTKLLKGPARKTFSSPLHITLSK